MVEEKSLHEENDWLTNYISLNDDTEEQEWGAQNETPQKKIKPDFVSILENNIIFLFLKNYFRKLLNKCEMC